MHEILFFIERPVNQFLMDVQAFKVFEMRNHWYNEENEKWSAWGQVCDWPPNWMIVTHYIVFAFDGAWLILKDLSITEEPEAHREVKENA